MQLSKNFTAAEFACPCCGVVKVDPEFLNMLQKLRDILGVPIPISPGGGCRCRKYNQSVGGAPESKHIAEGLILCRAVDVPTTDTNLRHKIIHLAGFVGLKGLGIYPLHIHLDKRDTPAFWVIP